MSSPVGDFPAFQPANVNDTGGPTVFRDPIFNPYDNNNHNNIHNNTTNNHHHTNTPTHHNNSRQRYKMADSGMLEMDAQEALAREFQPLLEVKSTKLLVGPYRN